MIKTWYAIYTKPRHEKMVHDLLSRDQFESFLPLVKTLKEWSDRKKWVEQVLFPSYLFVHVDQHQYLQVLKYQGVVRYVSFEGKAVAVPEKQIYAINKFVEGNHDDVNNLNNFSLDEKVEIVNGPMKGLQGEIVEFQGHKKVKIAIEAISQSVFLSIYDFNLKKIQ